MTFVKTKEAAITHKLGGEVLVPLGEMHVPAGSNLWSADGDLPEGVSVGRPRLRQREDRSHEWVVPVAATRPGEYKLAFGRFYPGAHNPAERLIATLSCQP